LRSPRGRHRPARTSEARKDTTPDPRRGSTVPTPALLPRPVVSRRPSPLPASRPPSAFSVPTVVTSAWTGDRLRRPSWDKPPGRPWDVASLACSDRPWSARAFTLSEPRGRRSRKANRCPWWTAGSAPACGRICL